MKDLGIYIHVPFCNARCTYCDFVSSVSSDDVKADYFTRLMRDIVLFPSKNSRADISFPPYISAEERRPA